MDIPDKALDHFKKAVWRVVEENAEALVPAVLGYPAALRRIAARGVDVRTVIDVGASDGRWSLNAKTVWPDARCHLIEAFDHWEPKLRELVAARADFSFTLAAAGPDDGETVFTNSPDAPEGGTTLPDPGDPTWIVPQVAIDGEVKRRGLSGPFLIKLDTHGSEREILAGAAEALQDAAVLVIEMYNFGDDARRFPQMCGLVESLGFHCIDIGDPLFRDHDKAFWQIDFFFVRKERPEACFSAWA